MKILECRELVKMYGKTRAVDSLSFSVEKGEVLGLLGPNGAGKTTTIKMILGLTGLSGGKVIIDRETKIGYSPETPYFHPFLTGYEVMRFYSRLQKLDRRTADQQIGRLLELAGLSGAAVKKVKNYSKGMLQRLAFAQALLGDPELLILDEPMSGLDALKDRNARLIGRQTRRQTIITNFILNDIEKLQTGRYYQNGRLAGRRANDLTGSREELFKSRG